MLISRPDYLDFLMRWKDHPVIKVVSGVRRCGKSTLFELFCERLRSEGVPPERMISINFEDLAYEDLRDHRRLYEHITSRLKPEGMNYVILDEIQHVPQFEKTVDSLSLRANADVYITGSNAWFMSGELATLLSGRYVELKMLPLSFAEFLSARPAGTDPARAYRDYVTRGSFPYVSRLTEQKQIYEYVDGLFSTVVLKDIVERRKIQDPAMLRSVLRFLFDSVGSLCSVRKIADSMTSAGRKISPKTVENYLEAITASLLMYRAERYDIHGRERLKLYEKYYLVDVGLRSYLLGPRGGDQGHVLENVVYLELLRRNANVFIGRSRTQEVDFVAIAPSGDEVYYQVSWSVREEGTLRRELAALDSVKNHSPKFLITMDNDPPVSYNGIRQVFALDWLLERSGQLASSLP